MKSIMKIVEKGTIYIMVLLMLLVFSSLSPSFLTLANFKAIFQSMLIICLMGVGTSFVVTAKEFDVSSGALLAVAPCIVAVLLRDGWPLFPVLLAGLIVTLGIGLLNGVLITKLKMPNFIATLGTSGICMGLSRIITGNKPVTLTNQLLLNSLGRSFLNIPKQIIWMMVLVLAGFLIMGKTRIGRNIKCVGDNKNAAEFYGINVDGTIIIAFIINAGFIFFCGMLDSVRSTNVSAGFGESFTLSALVATIIGGTSLSGGNSSVIGTFFGALFLTIISNGLFLISIPAWYINIIIGTIVLIVLTISMIITKREAILTKT